MLNWGDDVIVFADTQKLEWKINKSVNVKPKHTEKKVLSIYMLTSDLHLLISIVGNARDCLHNILC